MLLSYLRTLTLYLVLVAVIRLMGKRQVGQMEPTEFVVTMLVANLASIPMQDGDIPLYTGVVPIVTVLAMELILAGLSLKSIGLRRLICGKPVILIENGRMRQDNLRKTRVSLDELTAQLRLKNILDVTTVQYAILETNGSLSVFPYPQFRPANAAAAMVRVKAQSLPYTLVCDGKIVWENLKILGKNGDWLRRVLADRGCEIPQVWLFTVDKQEKMVLIEKEEV